MRREEKLHFSKNETAGWGFSYRIHCKQFTCNTTLTGGGGGSGGGGDSPE